MSVCDKLFSKIHQLHIDPSDTERHRPTLQIFFTTAPAFYQGSAQWTYETDGLIICLKGLPPSCLFVIVTH